MSRRIPKSIGWLVLLPALMLWADPAFAGSAIVGQVVRSVNATSSGGKVLPNTALMSGDSLRVKQGMAVVAIGRGSRLLLGPEAAATFRRDADEVTVLLDQGRMSIYSPEEAAALRVKVADIAIVPPKGLKTLGEVAMVDGALEVTANEGALRVQGPRQAVEVAKGKRITFARGVARSTLPAGGAAAKASSALAKGGLGGGWTILGVGAAGTGAAVGLSGKNPTAVEHVAQHIPDAACEHAASPSVPAVACE